MGFYSDGKVYGVQWVLYNEDDYEVLYKYEKTYTTPLEWTQIQEIETEFKKLPENDLKNLQISFYICCTSSNSFNRTSQRINSNRL